jgi:uncharacterized protein (DUF302 family)
MLSADGLLSLESVWPVKLVIDRLEAELRRRGLTVFARIDHAAGAASVGLTLRPTELIIFGNAKGGTPLMDLAQTVGIDLPLKMLAWEDESGTTRLSWNDVAYLARRHHVESAADPIIDALSCVQSALAEIATA